MKKISQLLLTAAVLGLVAPVVSSDVFETGAAYAKSENSNNGKGNSGGSKGNSGGSKGNSSNSNGKSSNAGGKSAGKEKPLASQMKSLNSLKRNPNGIMNSNDPKMAPFKEYLEAVEEYEEAVDAYDQAAGDYAKSFDDLAGYANELGLSEDSTQWENELDALRTELENNPIAEGEEGYDAYVEKLATLDEADAAMEQAKADKSVLDAAEDEVEATEGAASEEALIDAIVEAYNATGNGPVTADELTPEMIEFVKTELDF